MADALGLLALLIGFDVPGADVIAQDFLDQIIGRRRVGTIDRGKVAARRQQDLLNGEEVIFTVSIPKSVGGIRIRVTEDMRHAIRIA